MIPAPIEQEIVKQTTGVYLQYATQQPSLTVKQFRQKANTTRYLYIFE